jgi:hypothetical protein
MTGPRRELTVAVLACAAGAGLALFAATRTWVVDVVPRPEPLPALRTARTGGALLPWLPALAVVGLAGAGALVATRGAGRRAVAVLVLLVGVGLAIAGGYGVRLAPWAVLCLLGGLVVAAVGVAALRSGAGWPAMGSRYERGRPRAAPTSDAELWDAIDRGEDPTA